MSEPDPLPPLGVTLGVMLFGLPFVTLALRRAARVLTPRARPAFRWTSGEAATIVAFPFVFVAVVGFVLALLRGGAKDATVEPSVLLGLLQTQLVFGAAGALAVYLGRERAGGLASLGLAAPAPPGAFLAVFFVFLPGLVLSFGLAGAWAHVCRAFGWEERQEVLRLILGLGHGELFTALLLAVFVGPFLEELLFRGFLQGFMGQVVGERWAIVCTSALFARLHGLAGLPSLFLLSLFLGWLQQRTRSIWVSWSAHALNNGVSLGLALLLQGKLEGIP